MMCYFVFLLLLLNQLSFCNSKPSLQCIHCPFPLIRRHCCKILINKEKEIWKCLSEFVVLKPSEAILSKLVCLTSSQSSKKINPRKDINKLWKLAKHISINKLIRNITMRSQKKKKRNPQRNSEYKYKPRNLEAQSLFAKSYCGYYD
jgi:hypothetical protein